MKPFKNTSHEGNEKGFRRGKVVPKGDVNLAYVRSPELSPSENVVIVDTSRIVEENVVTGQSRCKLYYADQMGILADDQDNIVISDEYPAITDVFSVDEDFSLNPGSEYTNRDILPYRHVSRHLHLDVSALTMAGEEMPYESNFIKVVDGRGVEYDNYKTKIVAALVPNNTNDGDVWGYRVFAYVDTNENNNLFLQYNKVEISSDGTLINRQINYREILNPEPFFDYVPEESDVIDPNNRQQKIYSTKPISYKKRILDIPDSDVDGYKVFVPKKAVGDPRVYQLFRWRIVASFKQDVKVNPSEDSRNVKCGVLVTNKDIARGNSSFAPFALYNLSQSNYNVHNIVFRNPKMPNHDNASQLRRSYWLVNLDEDDLAEHDYDFLILSPNIQTFDYSKYANKLNHYVNQLGGTLFVDTNSHWDAANALGGNISRPVHSVTGNAKWSTHNSTSGMMVETANYEIQSQSHPLVDGGAQLGGWRISKALINLGIFGYTQHNKGKYSHCFASTPSGYNSIINAKRRGHSNFVNTVIARRHGRGRTIISTMGITYMANRTWNPFDGTLVSANQGSQLSIGANYNQSINSAYVEGPMKFLYNSVLWALQGKALDNDDELRFATTWEYSTKWFSSWVIDADVLSDLEKSEHNFVIDAADIHTGDLSPVWKRKLSHRTIKELVNRAIQPILDNPLTRNRIDESSRTYRIEITNPFVQTSSVVVENDYPYAYTEVHSPKFEVPAEIGPHIIKEEVGEDGEKGVVAKYEDFEFFEKHYPEQPYNFRVNATFAASEEHTVRSSTKYTAHGTARATVREETVIPATTTTTTRDIVLSWWDARVAPVSNSGNPTTPGSAFFSNTGFPDHGTVKPNGIRTWQEANYRTSAWGPGHLCWPHWGMSLRLVRGSSGEVVRFVQEALNRFRNAKYFSPSVGALTVDGQYGPKTSSAVLALQTRLNARYLDGVIDAETWFLIGSQILRLMKDNRLGPVSSTNHTKYFSRAVRMQVHRISNGVADNNSYSKRSWISNGPSTIWDMFSITFDKSYRWHGLTFIPYLVGNTQDMMFRSIHVTNERSLTGYNSTSGQLTYLPYRPRDGKALYIPFGPYSGNTIIIGVGQDRGSGSGTSRMFGIRDVRGHTRVTATVTIPSTTKVEYKSFNINFTVTGNVNVNSFEEKTVKVQPPNFNQYHSVSNISFNSITVDNPAIQGSITSKGDATFVTQLVTQTLESGTSRGPRIGDPDTPISYLDGEPYVHSMDENGKLNPFPEIGSISRAEGIKLICTKDKKPFGFPKLPTDVGPNEHQRHYTTLSLALRNIGAEVIVGFYDFKKKEFIGTIDGRPELPYIEYIKRGPQNIFVAVLSKYETHQKKTVPVDDDAPRLPQKWAMPVYGVCVKSGSRIALEPLPSRLGANDFWPVSVRDGKFSRRVRVRTRSEGKLSGWVSGYQGMDLEAFYAIPEADLGGFSTIYGRPNYDVVNEEPIIVDDNVIQVRQAPILLASFPGLEPSLADPVRPAITFYKRASLNDSWVEQPFSELRDYNTRTGEIFLRTRLNSSNPSLLRVDYTTKRRSYFFKKYQDQVLNLNTYSGHTRDLIGEAIYVYIVPHYVRDSNGQVIPESYHERTLRVAFNPSIFDPLDPEYDPLAVQLGVVYLSTALDLNKVAVIDTRRRGGGAPDSYITTKKNRNSEELKRLISASESYWDTGYATGASYPKSGFVVIRLPEELKEDFTEQEIKKIITKNITSGVGFKVEDLDGNDWSP